MSTSEPSTATVAVSEIRVFSAFLHRYQPEKTTQIGSPPKKDSVRVTFLTHLCTLFATGRPTSLDIAATGRVSPDAAEATIVVRSSNSSNSAETLVDPFREVHIQPRADFAMSDLLKLPKDLGSTVVDLRNYIADLLAAFRHVCSRPRMDSDETTIMTRWVLLHCHRSFQRRVQRHKYVWEEAPWEVMKNWHPTPEIQHAIRIEECSIEVDGITRILGAHGMPCGEHKSMPFNQATLPAWVRCLGALLSAVEQEVNAIKRFKDKTLGSNHGRIRRSNAILNVVQYLLSFDGIKQVITCDEFTSHLRLRSSTRAIGTTTVPKAVVSEARRMDETGKEEPTCNDDGDRNSDGSDDDGQPEERPAGKGDLEAEADEIRAAQKTPEETKGEHALWYLNSILAWHTAVDYVVGTLRRLYQQNSSSQLEMFLVELRDRPKTARDDVGVTGKSILKTVHKGKAWHQWVDENFHEILPSHFRVHAEAGCMALYEYSKQPDCSLPEDVLHALKTDTLPIGTSGECCHICYLLKDCLYATTQTDVLLRKTHGRVLPWDPPEFGIMPETLVTLAERLRDEVRVIASSVQAQPADKKDHSPHSSPESVVLPLLEDRKKLADMEFYSSFA